MAYDFLLNSANSLVSSLTDSLVKQKTCKEIIELKEVLGNANISMIDFFNNVKHQEESKFFKIFLSSINKPNFVDAYSLFLADGNKQMYHKLIKNILSDESLNSNEDDLVILKKLVDADRKKNVFTQNERNEILVTDPMIKDLLIKSGFYQLDGNAIENIKSSKDLLSKWELVESHYKNSGSIPNNISILLPSAYASFSDSQKINSSFLIDGLYQKLNKKYGKNVLFSGKYLSGLVDNLENNYPDFFDEDYNISGNLSSVVLGSDILSNLGCRYLSNGSEVKKDDIKASPLSYFSVEGASDFIDSLFQNYEDGSWLKKDANRILNDWFEKYCDYFVRDDNAKFLDPITKLMEKLKTSDLFFTESRNIYFYSLVALFKDDRYSFSEEKHEQMAEISKSIINEILGKSKIIEGYTKPYISATFNNVSKVLSFALDNADLSKNEKEDMFSEVLSSYICFQNINGSEKNDAYNMKFTILKFLTTVDFNFIVDFLNKDEGLSSIGLLEDSNISAKEVNKQDFKFDLIGFLTLAATDSLENTDSPSSNRQFTVEERKILINLAFSSNDFLKDVAKTKIGTSLYFTKMLKNFNYAEHIVKAIGNNKENPLVQEFLNVKSFKEAMSISPLDSAHVVLMQMQIANKINSLPLKKETKDVGNDPTNIFKL